MLSLACLGKHHCNALLEASLQQSQSPGLALAASPQSVCPKGHQPTNQDTPNCLAPVQAEGREQEPRAGLAQCSTAACPPPHTHTQPEGHTQAQPQEAPHHGTCQRASSRGPKRMAQQGAMHIVCHTASPTHNSGNLPQHHLPPEGVHMQPATMGVLKAMGVLLIRG